MTLPRYFKAQGDTVYLHAKVQPRASRNEIGEALGNELKIRVAAPPVDSAANEALVRFLADVLECPRSAVQLMRGQTSKHKVIAIRGVPPEVIVAKLSRS